MEHKEWVMVEGAWMEQDIDLAVRRIKKAGSRELEEAKMEVFSSFMNKLSKI